jgi:hypothetical protein
MSHGIPSLALSGILALGASFAAQAAAGDARQYYVTDNIVGSMLPQEIISSPVPFDGTYATLTAGQKAVLFQDYENLSPGDEPPFPLYGVRHLVKPLVPFADTWNPVGPLVASVEVDSRGNARAVTVYSSPDSRMTRIVSGALAFEKYKPASCGGQPCTMQYVLRLNFPARHAMPVEEVAFHHYDQATGDFTRH